MATKELQAVIEKVMNLGKLALSKDGDGDSSEEARTAAVKAIQLMKEHNLVVIPREEFDRVVAGQKELAAANEKANRNLMMGLAIGFFGGKGGLKF